MYCARHYALVNKPHPGFWRSAVIMILAMGLVSGLLAFLLRDVQDLSRIILTIVGLVFAIVPTAAWLVYFYQQDRLEPEPKGRIGSVLFTALVVLRVLLPCR